MKKVCRPKKTERGDPLGLLNIHIVAKHQKIEGDPLVEKKLPNASKKTWKAGSLSLSRYCMLRGKKEKLFGSVPLATGTILKFW